MAKYWRVVKVLRQSCLFALGSESLSDWLLHHYQMKLCTDSPLIKSQKLFQELEICLFRKFLITLKLSFSTTRSNIKEIFFLVNVRQIKTVKKKRIFTEASNVRHLKIFISNRTDHFDWNVPVCNRIQHSYYKLNYIEKLSVKLVEMTLFIQWFPIS